MNSEQATLINYLQKREYVIQKELSVVMNMTDREVRKIINSINEMYIQGQFSYAIIGNCYGCKLTNNYDEIKAYNHNKKCHALSELRNAYQMEKQMSKRNNMTFDDYINENVGG